MKIKLELFGATRDLSNKDFIEFIIEEKSSIKDLREKIIETSAFCTEDNNIVSDNYKIIKDQKIGIIPPIGGG